MSLFVWADGADFDWLINQEAINDFPIGIPTGVDPRLQIAMLRNGSSLVSLNLSNGSDSQSLSLA